MAAHTFKSVVDRLLIVGTNRAKMNTKAAPAESNYAGFRVRVSSCWLLIQLFQFAGSALIRLVMTASL